VKLREYLNSQKGSLCIYKNVHSGEKDADGQEYVILAELWVISKKVLEKEVKGEQKNILG